MPTPEQRTILGQPSFRIANEQVEAWITERGGHLGPITFNRDARPIAPMHVAPWAEEPVDGGLPVILKALRGDFFCMPFGGNDQSYNGEEHPPHGETANERWSLDGLDDGETVTEASFSLQTTARSGHVQKRIRLLNGHNAVYQEHVISAMTGPMSFGHHAMLRFPRRPGSGLLSFSSGAAGFTAPEPVETESSGGRSILAPGRQFDSLARVPAAGGQTIDLSRYPTSEHHEEIVMLPSDTDAPLAWSAVVFPGEGYAWFALKDPGVLRQTILWVSNGGRFYPPWNGRHTGVLGIEEVTSYFHYGLAQSAKENPLSREGIQTAVNLSPETPLRIRYVMACISVPAGFRRISRIIPVDSQDRVSLVDESGSEIDAAVDWRFVAAGTEEHRSRST